MSSNFILRQIRCMASLKDVRNRIKSVSNIQKLTKSMKMVSSAKYTRADREYQKFKDYIEFTEDLNSRLIPPAEDLKSRLIIAVASDRGLCGSCHTSVAKSVANSINKPNFSNLTETKVILIGEKIFNLRRTTQNIIGFVSGVGRITPTIFDSIDIVYKYLDDINNVDFVEIHSNKPENSMSFKTIVSVIPSGNAMLKDKNFGLYDGVTLETPEAVFHHTVALQLYFALRQSNTAEFMTRMVSMDNSSKNAGEMISGLQLKFNRTRQAMITRELIEIISGATALQEQ